ncbi:retrovirus-related pol polyprotein from transposon TNT 1-94 [Tanacetum coccineum]|uniref:Retrovirus-related pol polyprotein from transposon TNT 1-94 n=1 Tax=Tanacetum coccineum TaxID=301880 RepID=A0ABQ4WVP3_9ASTR
MAICLGVDLEPDEWIKDSGCSKHMTGNRKLFSTYKAYNGGNVIFGSNLRGNIIGKGQICDNKCRVTFSEHDSEITKDGRVIATIDENSTLWHRRLGHANMRLIQSLASKELVRNLPKLKFDQHFCDACKMGKQAHASHKAKNIVSTTRCLELLHMDLFGPSAVQSYGGNRYTLVIVDDYSRYTWTRFFKDKTEAFDQFEILSRKIQNQLGCSIVSIRIAHDREFDNEVQFGEFCNANGIIHNFSAPRTPQSNGVVERKNRTLQEMSRTMLNEQSLPQKFLCNIVHTSTYILNRILITVILGKTPYELLRGRKPTLDYFRVFGSKCFILNTKDYLTKFDLKSYEDVFLGYSENSKAYIILNKHTRKVKELLNVTFDETPPPSKTSPLVDDDLDEEEAIKVIEKKNLENDIVDETLEINEIVNIKESRNHPIENARLVAQGYNQQKGIDYDETYAPVARLESIRILLAYACALDFKLFQMDVKSAFLNGFINEEVYVAQPPGFIDFEKPDHVYKLKKALYGLKQAPKAWYDRLKAFILKHEYKIGMVNEHYLFTKKKSSNLIIVQIYVDDIIFSLTCQDMCDEFAKIMHDEFEMSMMGELNFFLGLQIKQMEDGIFFNQSKYIKEMLKKFGLEDSKPMKTPMSSDTKLTKDKECESVDSTKYRGMIGACVFTDRWRLDELAYGIPSDGPYQTNPPSIEDIILSIRIDREGQVRRIRHEEEIDVLEYQILTREIVSTLKPLEEIIRENVFCLGVIGIMFPHVFVSCFIVLYTPKNLILPITWRNEWSGSLSKLGTEGAVQQGLVRARVLNDLSAKEKERYKADICATNILLQGIPKDIYSLINHYTDAKDIWENERYSGRRTLCSKSPWKEYNANNQGRPFQRNNARGNGVAGNVGGQNRGGIINPGQAKPIKLLQGKMLLMASPESGAVLSEEPSVSFLAENSVTSYDSNTPSEVQDHDTFVNHLDEYHEVHEMQTDEQHNYVVDSDADYTSNSNIIPYDQYVEDNEDHVVQRNVSSVRNDALMSILDEMHEQGVQSRLANKPDMIINDSVASELARYKELVGEYEKRAKFELTDRERKIDEQMRIIISDRNRKETSLKSELHSAQILLSSTVGHYKSKTEEVIILKKDFKQKEDKFLEEFLDIKRLKDKIEDRLYKQDQSVQTVHMLCKPKSFYDEKNKVANRPTKTPLCHTRAKHKLISALYNGHVLVTTNHTPTVIHDSEDTREIAEITRKRMMLKCKPSINLTPEQIFWSIDDNNRKKAETSVPKPISALTVYPPNTPVKLVPRILPTKSQCREAPDFNSFFKIKNLEHQIQEKDNVIRHLKDLVANVNEGSCEPYNAKDVTALIEQNDCVRVELEKVKQHYKELYDSIKITLLPTSEKTSTMLNEIESLKAQLRSKESCFTSDYVKPKVLAPGIYMTFINANVLSNIVSLQCLSSLLNALLQNTMAEQNVPTQPPTKQMSRLKALAITPVIQLIRFNYLRLGIVTQTNVDHAELIWEEFTQGIQTFFSHKASHNASLKNPKKKVTPLLIPYGWFSKVIIYYLASNNNIHRRPESAVHHTGDDFILGNLKFVPKGESVEVFGMAIPDPLITEAIQQSSYYPKYLEMENSLEAHQEKGEGEGDDADMERAIKLSLDPAFLPQGRAPVGGVMIRDPVSETTSKLHEVVGKGKAVVTEEQVAHSLIDLSKKKRTTDQFILVRRDQTPHDSTTGPSSQPDDDTTEKVIHESSSTSDSERTESETEAAAPKGDKDQDEVDTSTVTSGVSIPVSDPEKAHEALAGPDPEPMKEDQTGSDSGKLHVSLAGPNPEHMDDEFLATAYPKEKSKVREESDSTIPDLSYSDSNVNSSSDCSLHRYLIEKYSVLPGPESIQNQESKKSPKEITIIKKEQGEEKQDSTYSIRSTDTVDLEEFDLKNEDAMDKEVADTVKDHKRKHDSDDDEDDDDDKGPSAGSNQDRSTKRRRYDSAASGSAQPPPKDDDQSLKKPRESDAYASKQHPALTSTGLQITDTRDAGVDSSMHRSDPDSEHSEQSSDDIPMQDEGHDSNMEDTNNAHIPRVSTTTWFKPILESERPATPKPEWTIPLNDFPEPEINWANTYATAYQVPAENKLQRKTYDIGSFIKWFCRRTGKKKLCKVDLEGPAFNLVKAFHKNNVFLQYQMDECHKLLTNKVDLSNPEGHQILQNIYEPLPLGGPPGQVTIQPQFFFNKDLDYLLTGDKEQKIALSISKLKAARYLDFVAFEELSPSLWVESEREYTSVRS